MNKVSGKKSSFNLISEDASRIVISYGCKKVTGKNLYEWYEIYIYKTKKGSISLQDVKDAIIADIDKRTDAKILNGYEFTPDGAEDPIVVWLSKESQTNFSEAHRLQIVPIKFKMNETEDKQAIYHEFETFEELNRFYTGGVQYINQCLNEGWQEKDSIDWTEYEALFPVPEQAANVEE